MVTRSRLKKLSGRTEPSRLKKVDYKEAMEGEGWAIGDYKDMVARAKTENEKKTLSHILKEEEQHLDELMNLTKCKVE